MTTFEFFFTFFMYSWASERENALNSAGAIVGQ